MGGYASGMPLGFQMLLEVKNRALSSLGVLLCLIHEDIFLYTLRILDIYKFFPSQMFLTMTLTLHIDPVR